MKEWAVTVSVRGLTREDFNPIFKSLEGVLPHFNRISGESATTLRCMTEEAATLAVYDILLTNQLTPAFRIFREKGTRQIHIYLGNFLMDLPPCRGRGAKDRLIIEKAWGGYL